MVYFEGFRQISGQMRALRAEVQSKFQKGIIAATAYMQSPEYQTDREALARLELASGLAADRAAADISSHAKQMKSIVEIA